MSFSALRKDVTNVLDFMERLKNEEDQKAVDVDLIEKLKFNLTFIFTYVQLSYSDLERFEDIMTGKRQDVENLLRAILDDVDHNVRCKYNMHHVIPSLIDNMDDCISSYRHFKPNATMMDEQLHFLLLNLHHLSKYCALFQLMAERVGHFLWEDQIVQLMYQEPFKIAHLLLKIVPIQLEVMLISYTNLKASTSAEVGHFIKQLLETSPDILRECLIHLQEHMVTVITASTPGARNIHVMMEFLLIILTDVPGDLIHHDKFFDLLARVGLLTREVLSLVSDLEEKSRNKERADETNRATLHLQESIELLKQDLKDVYLKAPNSSQCCFPMNDGPLFMHLLQIHLNDLLDSNAYSVALIKEEIALVKQDLEFIRSFFVNVEQGLYKDNLAVKLQTRSSFKMQQIKLFVKCLREPTDERWKGVKRILQYLKAMATSGL